MSVGEGKRKEKTMTDRRKYIAGSVRGLIVGDALGVPVEFRDREYLRENPVTDMMEYGTHHQPKGTWSDDSSMMLCTLDSISKGEIDCDDIMSKFAKWKYDGEYTPYGEVFDCGITTSEALAKYRNGAAPMECGGRGERDNGNGSLMRILPAALYQIEHGDPDNADIVRKVSALTHAHPVSMAGCELYTEILGAIIRFRYGESKSGSILDAMSAAFARNHCEGIGHYYRLEDMRAFAALPEDKIKSGGYVVSTLEAALWCFLNTDNYADCVLKAVNLGGDTDTTAAVAGSIAGAYYGVEGIPAEWIECIARKEWIAELIDRFEVVINSPSEIE